MGDGGEKAEEVREEEVELIFFPLEVQLRKSNRITKKKNTNQNHIFLMLFSLHKFLEELKSRTLMHTHTDIETRIQSFKKHRSIPRLAQELHILLQDQNALITSAAAAALKTSAANASVF